MRDIFPTVLPLARRVRRRATSMPELLVVLTILMILVGLSSSLYVTSRRSTEVESQASKIRKAFITARSFAIAKGTKHYQVTFFLDEPGSFWLDSIDRTATTDLSTIPDIDEPKITTPEYVFDTIEIVGATGGIYNEENNTWSYRFFNDGSCDGGSIFLKRFADDAEGSKYCEVKLYGATSQVKIKLDQAKPAEGLFNTTTDPASSARRRAMLRRNR